METDYYRKRRTLDSKVELEGTGLHTGEPSTVILEPADSGDGIQFRNGTDDTVRAIPDNVSQTGKCTVLESNGVRVATVEHLLSALFAKGLTDVSIQIDGPEVPALDGASESFFEQLGAGDLRELDGQREVVHVEEPIAVRDGDSSLIILPSTELCFDVTISYDDQPVEDQFLSYELRDETYDREIAPAKTYGFEDEIEELLEEGLAQGGSFENAHVVASDGGFLGQGPSMEKELVRHKILDIIGDLALTEVFPVGKVVAVKPSHSLNVEFSRKIREEFQISVDDDSGVPSGPVLDGNGLDIKEILEVLPHRYPFLLIDRVVSYDLQNTKAVGFKNVTMNEEFFQGHFPDDPVMPGVLIVEAMAQLGASCILNKPEYEGKNSYFMGLDDVKWREPVRPGDRVYFEVEGRRMKSKYGVVDGKARVDGDVAAEATVKFAIVEQ